MKKNISVLLLCLANTLSSHSQNNMGKLYEKVIELNYFYALKNNFIQKADTAYYFTLDCEKENLFDYYNIKITNNKIVNRLPIFCEKQKNVWMLLLPNVENEYTVISLINFIMYKENLIRTSEISYYFRYSFKHKAYIFIKRV